MLLTNDSDRDWERFGQTDPYYGVLSEERYRGGSISGGDRTAFFRSGRDHVDRMFSIIRAHLDVGFAPKRALDFGCGVGRVLVPLAERCDQVTGIDISASMLAEAKRNCEEMVSARNVRFALADDTLSNVEGAYEFIHSYIVLQHIPVDRGEHIVRELASHLAPGGVGMFHVTYRHSVRPLGRVLYWARMRVPAAHALLNVVVGRSPSAPIMQANDYSVTRLLDILRDIGCGEIHVRFSDHQGQLGVLIFCRRVPLPVFS